MVIVLHVANASEPNGGQDQVRALELRLERETAVLLDRLNLQSEELERAQLELVTARTDRDQAQARVGELEAQLSAVGSELGSRLAAMEASPSWRLTKPLRWMKRKAGR